MKDLLGYRQTRKKNEQSNIEDVLDGRLYKAHFADDGYFKDTEDNEKKRRTSHFTPDKHRWGCIVQIINIQYLASVLSCQ